MGKGYLQLSVDIAEEAVTCLMVDVAEEAAFWLIARLGGEREGGGGGGGEFNQRQGNSYD